VIDDPGLLLKGYEYVNGTTPRSVRRAFYEDLSVSIRPDASASDALKQLPIDHFVWSDELAAAFSNFVENFHEPEDAYRQSMGLEWNPAFHGTEALIAECVDLSSLEDDAGASASQQGDYVFRRSQAGGWEISFEGRKCGPFKDSLGLQYLKQLLQNPNRTVSAMELCAVVRQPERSDRDAARATTAAAMARSKSADGDEPRTREQLNIHYGGDAGEAIDAQALQAYRTRLRKLVMERQEAEESGDAEWIAKIDGESEDIKQELSRSVRPDGTPRRAHAVDKKAYDAVANNIRRAIADLKKHCNALGQHLDDHVEYIRADGWRYHPKDKIDWKF
jgi:uncharacterized protein YecT (DUF1311 family)